ncbi:hypothetical protein EHF33_06095 [Deinococcus psychrotolerans]|uniref:Uncharacterized protein n=1 Tax=Deinococcus psychrotolerans TaxID=2489213 RepID=A0A3G8YIL4_9DEIO|nr:hypothetical protein [Deinococcus psychrotolerans]AZI42374.1 hypothetical protein EHF33_06095 [Deinococcus psychrotolerans]
MKAVNAPTARRAALTALWLQVVTLVIYGIYDAFRKTGADLLLGSLDVVLATISLALWTVLLGNFLRGETAKLTDARLRVFRLTYPWLIALRAAVWLLTVVAILSGAGDTANPIAVLLLFVVWGGGIAAGLALYTVSAVLFASPADTTGRARLMTWLNLSAMLGVAITVTNIWPPTGFVPMPKFSDQLIWAGLGLEDLVATLLALWAVRLMGGALVEGEKV